MEQFKVGEKVHYTAPHGKKENGMVKSVSECGNFAFVVYHCNNEWNRYYDFTGSSTNIKHLTKGWI